MRTVRISLRTARLLLTALEHLDSGQTLVGLHHPQEREVLEALRAAIKPKRSVVASRRRKDSKKKTKREETAEIRAAVMKRAGVWCEVGQDACPPPPLELDHFFGRRGEQSERTCWALCFDCHRAKTRNEPSAAEWLGRFISHCHKYGYDAEANRARARLHGVVAMRAKETTR